jgi:hypothetical protein
VSTFVDASVYKALEITLKFHELVRAGNLHAFFVKDFLSFVGLHGQGFSGLIFRRAVWKIASKIVSRESVKTRIFWLHVPFSGFEIFQRERSILAP